MSECIKTEGIKNLKVYLDSLDSIGDIENVIINMRANKEIYIEERENNIWIYL